MRAGSEWMPLTDVSGSHAEVHHLPCGSTLSFRTSLLAQGWSEPSRPSPPITTTCPPPPAEGAVRVQLQLRLPPAPDSDVSAAGWSRAVSAALGAPAEQIVAVEVSPARVEVVASVRLLPRATPVRFLPSPAPPLSLPACLPPSLPASPTLDLLSLPPQYWHHATGTTRLVPHVAC